MKTTILAFIYSITAYLISMAVDIACTKLILQHITFSRHFGFIDTIHLAEWLPAILLYGAIGWFLPKLLRANSARWVVITIFFILTIEMYLTHHAFTEEADLIDKAWSYLGYFVPSLSVLMGYFAMLWLTKSSSGTTNSAGAPFVAP